MSVKKNESDIPSWESMIGQKIESHRETYAPQRIEDPGERNKKASQKRATKKWRKKNWDHYMAKQKEWVKANPEKVKIYQQRNKKNIKRWTEEHPERVRELNRKSDRKRAKSPKRIAWNKEYRQRPDVIERRREYDRARNKTPERRAYDRERKRKKREEMKAKKEAA